MCVPFAERIHPFYLLRRLWIMNKSIRYAVCVPTKWHCVFACMVTVAVSENLLCFFYRSLQKDNRIEIPGWNIRDAHSRKINSACCEFTTWLDLDTWRHDLELYDFSLSAFASPLAQSFASCYITTPNHQMCSLPHGSRMPCSTTHWHQTSHYNSQSQYANQFMGVFGLYSYVLCQLFGVGPIAVGMRVFFFGVLPSHCLRCFHCWPACSTEHPKFREWITEMLHQFRFKLRWTSAHCTHMNKHTAK